MKRRKNGIKRLYRIVSATTLIGAILLSPAAGVRAQDKKPTTGPDSTFGAGGTKKTTPKKDADGTITVETEYRDANNKLRRKEVDVTKPNGDKTKTREDYDCDEKLVSKELETEANNGRWTTKLKEQYKDGKVISGTLDEDFDGVKKHKEFDPKTEKYEEGKPGTPAPELPVPVPPCPLPFPNELTGGPSIIREDASPESFNTFGFSASFTRYLNRAVGLSADFNANFRDRGGAELSKISLLGGVTVLPFRGARTADKVTVSSHALFGVAHFKADNGTTSFTDNAFAMKLGAAVDVNVNRRFFVRAAQVDYAPTFFGNNTQHNVQLGFGLGLRF